MYRRFFLGVFALSIIFLSLLSFHNPKTDAAILTSSTTPAEKADALLKYLEDLKKEIDAINLAQKEKALQGQIEISGTGDFAGASVITFGLPNGSHLTLFDKTERTISIKNKSSEPLTFVSLDGLGGAFSFKGGVYPGTGGTCKNILTGTCTIVVVFEPNKGNGTFFTEDVLRYRTPPIKLLYTALSKQFESNALVFSGFSYQPSDVSIKISSSVLLTASLEGTDRNLIDIDSSPPVPVGSTAEFTAAFSSAKTSPQMPFRDLNITGLTPPFSIKSNNCTEPGLIKYCEAVLIYRPVSGGTDERDIVFSWNDGKQIQKKTFHLKALAAASDELVSQTLILYNQNNSESVEMKNYYLANRPGFANANTLGINYDTQKSCAGETVCLSGEAMHKYWFTETIGKPLTAWLQSHPDKKITTMILMRGIPNRFVNAAIPEAGLVGSIQNGIGTSFNIFSTSLDMGSVEASKAYIDKLKDMYGRMPSPKVLISSEGTGKQGSHYYIENVHDRLIPGLEGVGPAEVFNYNEAMKVHSSSAQVLFRARGQQPFTQAENVLGYVGWAYWGKWGGNYAINGDVKFSGNSGWYLINTFESFNGMWTAGAVANENFQGNFIKWFSRNAFGGTNYENTPVGAVTTIEEPSAAGKNGPGLFTCWDSGKPFIYCAWSSIQSPFFQGVGDPWVAK